MSTASFWCTGRIFRRLLGSVIEHLVRRRSPSICRDAEVARPISPRSLWRLRAGCRQFRLPGRHGSLRARRPFAWRGCHHRGGVRHPDRITGLVYVGALVPAPEESPASVIFGDDLPPEAPRMPTEERAKLFFANDMTDEQWAEVWKQFVPESARLWNARLSGYPRGMPVTYVSHDRRRGGAPGVGGADDRQPRHRCGPPSALGGSHRDGDEAVGTRRNHQRLHPPLT